MNSNSKWIKGAFILTVGTVISKIIGLLYIIPFNSMINDYNGAELFQYSYTPYIFFITIATAGFPQAVSKITAKYNALGEYRQSRRFFQYGQIFMLIMGLAAFLLLFFTAPMIAKGFHANNFAVADITFTLRMVAIALLIIPTLSFTRGYFQGHGEMLPTSVSQVTEQITRVVFLLISVYLVVVKFEQSIVLGIGMATAAAFIGAIFAVAVMYYFLYKQRDYFNDLLAQDKATQSIPLRKMFGEVLVSSIPFILVAITLPGFQLIDNFTINRMMQIVEPGMNSGVFNEIINFKAQQIIMIPMAIATALQISIVPTIAAVVAKENLKATRPHIDKVFLITLFILIPASFGIMTLSNALYPAFYESSKLGVYFLAICAPLVVFFAMTTVSASILQGMNKQSFSIKSLAIGVFVKIIANITLLYFIGATGAVISSALGYATIATLNMMMIHKQTQYPWGRLLRRAILIVLLSIMMVASLAVTKYLLNFVISIDTRFNAIVYLIICVPIGVTVYFILAHKIGLLEKTLGARATRFMKRLRL